MKSVSKAASRRDGRDVGNTRAHALRQPQGFHAFNHCAEGFNVRHVDGHVRRLQRRRLNKRNVLGRADGHGHFLHYGPCGAAGRELGAPETHSRVQCDEMQSERGRPEEVPWARKHESARAQPTYRADGGRQEGGAVAFDQLERYLGGVHGRPAADVENCSL